jgi:hypothetical protein
MPTHALNDTHLGSLAVYLQSKDATASLASASKLFYLNQIIMPPPDTSILVGLISAEVPYTFYNVNSNNNTMTIQQITGALESTTLTANIVLPQQNYDTDEMIDTMKELLLAASPPLSFTEFTFDEDSNKFTLKHTGTGADIGTVKITASTMKNIMGFTESQLNVAAQSITADHCVNLAGTSSVYVNLPNIGLSNLDSRGDLNGVVSKLNVNCNPGEYIFYQQTETQYYLISNPKIDFFHLSLTDDDNNLLEMNGGDFSITLSIHFSKKRTPFTSEEYLQKRPSQTPAIEEQPKEQPKEKKRNKKKQK